MKLLLYATPTHLPSICPFTRPHVLISALSMHLPPVHWAWIRAPATHFLGARILTTLILSTPRAALSALPQPLPSRFSVIVLSSQYLFQRGPIWIELKQIPFICCNIAEIICIHIKKHEVVNAWRVFFALLNIVLSCLIEQAQNVKYSVVNFSHYSPLTCKYTETCKDSLLHNELHFSMDRVKPVLRDHPREDQNTVS